MQIREISSEKFHLKRCCWNAVGIISVGSVVGRIKSKIIRATLFKYLDYQYCKSLHKPSGKMFIEYNYIIILRARFNSLERTLFFQEGGTGKVYTEYLFSLSHSNRYN